MPIKVVQPPNAVKDGEPKVGPEAGSRQGR